MSSTANTAPIATFEWGRRRRPTESLFDTLREVHDTSLSNEPPLYDVLNPDALDALFSPSTTRDIETNGYVTFTYLQYIVVVDDGGGGQLFDREAIPGVWLRTVDDRDPP